MHFRSYQRSTTSSKRELVKAHLESVIARFSCSFKSRFHHSNSASYSVSADSSDSSDSSGSTSTSTCDSRNDTVSYFSDDAATDDDDDDDDEPVVKSVRFCPIVAVIEFDENKGHDDGSELFIKNSTKVSTKVSHASSSETSKDENNHSIDEIDTPHSVRSFRDIAKRFFLRLGYFTSEKPTDTDTTPKCFVSSFVKPLKGPASSTPLSHPTRAPFSALQTAEVTYGGKWEDVNDSISEFSDDEYNKENKYPYNGQYNGQYDDDEEEEEEEEDSEMSEVARQISSMLDQFRLNTRSLQCKTSTPPSCSDKHHSFDSNSYLRTIYSASTEKLSDGVTSSPVSPALSSSDIYKKYHAETRANLQRLLEQTYDY